MARRTIKRLTRRQREAIALADWLRELGAAFHTSGSVELCRRCQRAARLIDPRPSPRLKPARVIETGRLPL